MTADAFRQLALSLPESVEGSHMSHPDFRVGGKIFATLSADGAWAMVKLTPPQQADFIRAKPKMFEPVSGGWGQRGATKVLLKTATKTAVTPALVAAWKNTAPAGLSDDMD
jgi:hypothetical protein